MPETFVLIHGAWHTGEDFETIANILRDAEIQKTDTYQSGGRLPEGFFAKKHRTTDRAHFLSEGPLPT